MKLHFCHKKITQSSSLSPSCYTLHPPSGCTGTILLHTFLVDSQVWLYNSSRLYPGIHKLVLGCHHSWLYFIQSNMVVSFLETNQGSFRLSVVVATLNILNIFVTFDTPYTRLQQFTATRIALPPEFVIQDHSKCDTVINCGHKNEYSEDIL